MSNNYFEFQKCRTKQEYRRGGIIRYNGFDFYGDGQRNDQSGNQ